MVGKTASCAAIALTVGAYAWPEWRRPIAVGAVVALTAVNYRGISKMVRLTRAIVAVVLAALAAVVVGFLAGGQAATTNLGPLTVGGSSGILESAGLLFGFSSFAVLTYYAITNIAAWTLPTAERRWPRPLALLGVAGCETLQIWIWARNVADLRRSAPRRPDETIRAQMKVARRRIARQEKRHRPSSTALDVRHVRTARVSNAGDVVADQRTNLVVWVERSGADPRVQLAA